MFGNIAVFKTQEHQKTSFSLLSDCPGTVVLVFSSHVQCVFYFHTLVGIVLPLTASALAFGHSSPLATINGCPPSRQDTVMAVRFFTSLIQMK